MYKLPLFIAQYQHKYKRKLTIKITNVPLYLDEINNDEICADKFITLGLARVRAPRGRSSVIQTLRGYLKSSRNIFIIISFYFIVNGIWPSSHGMNPVTPVHNKCKVHVYL